MAKTTASDKLITAIGKTAPPPTDPLPDYITKLLYVQNRDLAAKLLAEHAGIEFDINEGKDIPLLELELEELEFFYRSSLKQIQKLKDTCNNTEQEIICPTDERKGFLSWALKDQLAITLLVPTLLVVMAMGAANAYANLMASGEPVFLDQPWLAVTLSALVPAGSTALKFISHFFDHGYTKKRYALGIYVITFIAIMAWSIVFSLNFTGVTGGIDWETLGESDGGKGPLLVFLQMACEILVAAALFLAIEQISLIYNRPLRDFNPEFTSAQRAFQNYSTDHGKLGEKRNQISQDLSLLRSKRKKHISTRAMEFNALISSRNV